MRAAKLGGGTAQRGGGTAQCLCEGMYPQNFLSMRQMSDEVAAVAAEDRERCSRRSCQHIRLPVGSERSRVEGGGVPTLHSSLGIASQFSGVVAANN